MASRRTHRDGRDLTTPIANATPTPKFIPKPLHRLEPIRSLEDRRLFHPEKQYQPARAARVAHRRIVPTKTHQALLPKKLQFNVPHKVAICARRKIREQVLHALRKTGKGGGRGRRNFFSTISCR